MGYLLSLPRIDLAVLLGKTPSSMENESTNLESSQAPSLAQPLVFSNSKQSAISQPASGNSFSHHSMVRKHSSLPACGFWRVLVSLGFPDFPCLHLGNVGNTVLTPACFLWVAVVFLDDMPLCSKYRGMKSIS